MIKLSYTKITLLLNFLYHRPDSSSVDIGKFILASTNTTILILAKLMRKGLVDRSGTKRKYTYNLTPLGIANLENFRNLRCWENEGKVLCH
jgi:predicted transcriptional regulator